MKFCVLLGTKVATPAVPTPFVAPPSDRHSVAAGFLTSVVRHLVCSDVEKTRTIGNADPASTHAVWTLVKQTRVITARDVTWYSGRPRARVLTVSSEIHACSARKEVSETCVLSSKTLYLYPSVYTFLQYRPNLRCP